MVVAKPEDHAHVPKKLQRRHRHRKGMAKSVKKTRLEGTTDAICLVTEC